MRCKYSTLHGTVDYSITSISRDLRPVNGLEWEIVPLAPGRMGTLYPDYLSWISGSAAGGGERMGRVWCDMALSQAHYYCFLPGNLSLHQS